MRRAMPSSLIPAALWLGSYMFGEWGDPYIPVTDPGPKGSGVPIPYTRHQPRRLTRRQRRRRR